MTINSGLVSACVNDLTDNRRETFAPTDAAETPAIDEDATVCPLCLGPLAHKLDVNRAGQGGLRYDVSCPPCGVIYFEVCSQRPPAQRHPSVTETS